MKAVRWAAVAVTVLLSLMNLPFAFDDGGTDLAAPLAWAVTITGALGLVAATGLLLRASWGRPAVLGFGVLNLAGAVAALAAGSEGAATGLVVSALVVVLAWFAAPRPVPTPA